MAEASEAGLRLVREEELEQVRGRLARHLPHSIMVYNAVTMAKRYGLHALGSFSILVPACPQPSCLTVISNPCTGVVQMLMMFWSPEEDTASDVVDQLSRLTILDWSKPVWLLPITTAPLALMEALGSVGSHRVSYYRQRNGHVYTFDKEAEAKDEGLAPQYLMTSLSEKDAAMVWEHWGLNNLESLANFRRFIHVFPSVGIHKSGPSDLHQPTQNTKEETLVSWVRLCKFGWMGNTFTLPQYRRQGLARAATLALARQMLNEGLLPYVIIDDTNETSITMHERMKFHKQCSVHIALVVPDQDSGEQIEREEEGE